jgi:long-chain acyl-CoA synthetase
MAETSALTHTGDRARPRPDSVGRPVTGTECRVVDLDTGAVLPAGERGEVQVRGPQMTVGYLGRTEPAVDADGWLHTGDVGWVDPDGYLVLVDRLGDLFKVGNELVAPSEIERVLITHPDIRDCVVVDYPDEFSGRVPYALVIPHGTAGESRLAEMVAYANRQLPAFQHIRGIAVVDAIPGAQFGKIRRRELREQLLARVAQPTHTGGENR